MHIIINGQFDVFLGTLHGNNEERSTKYAVSQSRLEKVIKAEHQTISSELSECLKTMENISVVVHQWEGDRQESMLLFSVFFVDQEWNKKSYLVAAEPLNSPESRKQGICRVYTMTC